MKTSEIFLESLSIRDKIKTQNDFRENPIDNYLPPVMPFRITDKIKLIFIGQDPTIKNQSSRGKIKYTLNLDKNGSLKNYLSKICSLLVVSFENIYATNVFKYFYSIPPEKTISVLENHLAANLELLNRELKQYSNVPIITLGLPVLQLLTNKENEVHNYWGYNKKTKKSESEFSYCNASKNKLMRDFFPFPHQPSILKKYYSDNLKDYIEFMKSSIRI